MGGPGSNGSSASVERVYYCPRCAAGYIDAEGGCDYCPGEELSLEPPDPEDLGAMVLLAEMSDRFALEQARLCLEAAHVPVRLETSDSYGGMMGANLTGRSKLFVPENCLERARDLLSEFTSGE